MKLVEGIRWFLRRTTNRTLAARVTQLGGRIQTFMNSFTDFQLFVLEKGELVCSDVRKMYGDYVDGDLPSSLRCRIDAHVEDCPRCQEFAATYKLTIDLAHDLGKQPIPSDVQRRLRANLNQRLGINLPTP
jgi:hypothetical protein